MRHGKVLGLFAGLLLLMLTGGCNSSGSDNPPVLQNLVVDIGVEPNGAFILSPDQKVFLEFGAEVLDQNNDPKILPTFEYRVDPAADVRAPIDGRITRVEFQDNDWVIWLKPHGSSSWLIEVDHVLDLTPIVAEGNNVQAGDVLGKPGTWGGGLGRVELLIVRGNTHHCPFSIFDAALIDQYRAQVTALMDAIEAQNNTGQPFYDQQSMVEPGCNALTYPAD